MNAIKNSTAYDADIRNRLKEGKSGEELFFELALPAELRNRLGIAIAERTYKVARTLLSSPRL